MTDDEYLLTATRYLELNPVRAKLTADPTAYPWSSAAAHLTGRDDRLVVTEPLLRMEPDWGAFLARGLSEEQAQALRYHERTGRPAGSDGFVTALEIATGRVLRRGKSGPQRAPSN